MSHIPYLQALRQGQFHRQAKRLHLQYGPIVRLSPDEVSFTDSEAWTAIYAYQAGGCFAKSPRWYQPRINGAYGIMSSPPADHGRFRRTFAPAFKEKALHDQESVILHHTNILMDKILAETKQGSVVNLTNWLEYAAFDIAGDFAFSEPFDCLNESKNRVQIHIIQSALKTFALSVIPRTSRLLSLWSSAVLFWHKSSNVRASYYKSLTSWTRRRLEEGDTPGKDDLMAWIVRRTGDGKELTTAEAENALSDFLLAGTETVASTMVAVLYYLCQSPEVKAHLEKEVRTAFTNKVDIGIHNTENLEYLNAVVKESMRLCPTLPNTLPRIVAQPGALICGRWFPAGVREMSASDPGNTRLMTFADIRGFLPIRCVPFST